MRISSHFLIEDAGLVDPVNADATAGVDKGTVAEHHAHMHYSALLVLEEGQVTDTSLVDEVERLTTKHLLGGIAVQLHPDKRVKKLHKTGTIDTQRGSTTP